MILRLRQVKEYEDGVLLSPHLVDHLNPEIDELTFAYFILEWNQIDGAGWRKTEVLLGDDDQ